MAELLKELNNLALRDGTCSHDAEDPIEACSFNTCLEEKKYLLKSYQKRRYFGKHIPLLWKNNEPLITLGPQCK